MHAAIYGGSLILPLRTGRTPADIGDIQEPSQPNSALQAT